MSESPPPERRYCTVEQAGAMVPDLERAFGRMLQMRAQVREAWERLDARGFAPPDDEFVLQPPGADAEITGDLSTLRALVDALRTELTALAARGCVVKDLDSGLVDWYALRDGREIFLCWKLGEKVVDHWHELDAGFAGRQRL